MRRPSNSAVATRVVAALLAAVWILGGLVAIARGVIGGQWVPACLGALAVWYGLLWVRVAREGRQLRWPDGLRPWGRS